MILYKQTKIVITKGSKNLTFIDVLSKNSLFAFFSKALEGGKPLIISLLVAMLYSIDEYGQFAYTVAIFMIISVLAEFRLQSVLIKEFSTSGLEKTGSILGSAFSVNFLFACTGFFLAGLFSFFEESELVSYGLMVISFSFFAKIPRSYRAVYIAHQRYKLIVNSEFISGLISTLLILIFTMYHANLIWIFVIRVFDNIILSLLLYRSSKSIFYCSDIPLSFDYNCSKKLVKLSFPLVISGSAMILFQKIDLIMVKNILGDTDAGYYAFAAIFMTVFSMPALIFSESLAPKMFKSDNKKNIIKQNFSNVIITVGFLMSIIMFISVVPIINIFFHGKYDESLGVIKIMSMVPLLIALGAAAGQIIVHDQSQKRSFIKSFMGLFVSIAFNFTLIPYIGILGAAVSTILGLIVSNYIGHVFFKEYRYIFIMQCKSLVSPFYLVWKKKND